MARGCVVWEIRPYCANKGRGWLIRLRGCAVVQTSACCMTRELLGNGPLCNAQHVLNCSPTALTDGRCMWRHDMVLATLLPFLQRFKSAANIYTHLPNHRTCESPPATIPPTIVGTTTRPDFFVIDGKHATILELTVPWNNLSSIKNARARKQGKTNYQLLDSDLSALGYQVQLLTIDWLLRPLHTRGVCGSKTCCPTEQSL